MIGIYYCIDLQKKLGLKTRLNEFGTREGEGGASHKTVVTYLMRNNCRRRSFSFNKT